MMVLKYDDIELPIIDDNYSIDKSSQEVSFSDLTCDFTDKEKEQLPEKYQEIKVYDKRLNKVKFIGYLDSYNLGEMREVDVDRTINVTLISPMSLATLRTATVIGTYEINDLIRRIFQPLIDDGFEIKELNITSRMVTVNYLVETVEHCMNNLSNSYNIWWFVDENKKIYIKDVDYMLKQDPKHVYDDKNRIAGLQYLKPIISSGGYANVVNIKNVRVFNYSRMKFSGNTITNNYNGLLDNQISTLKNYSVLTLNNPVDISKNNILKSANSNGVSGRYFYGIYCTGMYTDGNTFEFYCRVDKITGNLSFSDNLSIDGIGVTTDFSLVKDTFFTSLITGIKYNGEKEITYITELNSDSVLMYNIIRVFNDKAIEEKVNKISSTGIVETTIDLNEQWKTIQEIEEIGISYMDKNSIEFDGKVQALTDEDVFQVGDIVKLDKMFFNDKYVVSSIQENNTNNDESYLVTLNNTRIMDSYIDLFRSSSSQQDSDEIPVIITHYYEENINEVHEVV